MSVAGALHFFHHHLVACLFGLLSTAGGSSRTFQVKDLLAELSEEERAELSPPEEGVALHPMGGNAVPVDQTSSSRADDAEQEIRVQADGKSDTEDMPEESDKLEEEVATSEPGAGNVVPAEQTPPSRVEDTEQEFRMQVATFPELHGITMNNRDALEEVKDLLGNPAPGTSGADFRSGTELIDVNKLRELDELVSIAKALGGMVVSTSLAFSVVVQQPYAGHERAKYNLVRSMAMFRIQQDTLDLDSPGLRTSPFPWPCSSSWRTQVFPKLTSAVP